MTEENREKLVIGFESICEILKEEQGEGALDDFRESFIEVLDCWFPYSTCCDFWFDIHERVCCESDVFSLVV
jgi:hypothetical protein